MADTTILAIPGSLRTASVHRGLTRAAAELAPAGVQVNVHELRGIPVYDGDLTTAPPEVESFRAALEAADGVLIAAPEYNFSISGVLKNAIDWGSRPAFASPFAMKKCAMMAAAPGPVGGARGLEHLKLILHGMGAHVSPGRTLTFGQSKSRFDESGNLVDAEARDRLRGFLADFVSFVQS